jgi:uncharacterized membrane protein SirB2
MNEMQLLSLAIFIIMGIIGALMSEKRHRNKIGGFALGFFLGLIGIAVIAVVGEKKIEETKGSDI